jgi:hypothetical protein
MNNTENMVPVEKRFKHWIYGFVMEDGLATLSDGTKYRIEQPSGAFIRVSKKAQYTQRERRRLMGKIRRSAGMTRSEYDKRNNEQAAQG